MILVTTALKETFPKNTDERVLFLGEWCKFYSEKKHWSVYSSITLDYYWNDKNRTLSAVQYTDIIYEKYLKILSEQLNKIHNEQYSERYWRIVVGYWLRQFIDIVYDKYTLVEKVFADNKINKTYKVGFEKSDAVPLDMHDFNRIKASDDWNHFIYSFLLGDKECNIVKVGYKRKILRIKTPANKNKNKIKQISMRLNRFNRIAFYISYIERKTCAKLQLLLGQIPALDYIEELSLFANYDENLRSKLDMSADNAKGFESILKRLIKIQIPCSYLESYQGLKEEALNRYSSKVKLIVATPSSVAFHDDFKIWTANKVEDGVKLVLAQHGGLYGTVVSNSLEQHEIAIADKFFSWGWSRGGYDNIKPMPAIKLLEKIDYNPHGDMLMPLLDAPRYTSFLMASEVMSTQILDYTEDQIEFLTLLPRKISKHIKLRMFTVDDQSGWNIRGRLSDCRFEGLIDNLENSNKKFSKRLSECRLCIATYNATTFLETFSNNFPTLLFWNENHYTLHQNAKPYFDKLHEAGILHYNAKSLAKKVEEIYQDPLQWWTANDIQQAKNEFCIQFANIEKNPLEKWCRELKKIANDGR